MKWLTIISVLFALISFGSGNKCPISPSESPEKINDISEQLFSAGLFLEAADCFQRVTTLLPLSGVAWSNLGAALDNSGKWHEALDAFKTASELEPNDHISAYGAGKLAMSHLQDPALAEKYLSKSLKSKRTTEALLLMGQVQMRKSEWRQAIRTFSEAEKMNSGPSGNPILSMLQAECYFSLGKYQKAIALARRALAIEPSFALARRLVINSLKAQDNCKDMIDELLILAQQETDIHVVHLNLGQCYIALGDIESAAPWLMQAWNNSNQTDPRLLHDVMKMKQKLGHWHKWVQGSFELQQMLRKSFLKATGAPHKSLPTGTSRFPTNFTFLPNDHLSQLASMEPLALLSLPVQPWLVNALLTAKLSAPPVVGLVPLTSERGYDTGADPIILPMVPWVRSDGLSVKCEKNNQNYKMAAAKSGGAKRSNSGPQAHTSPVPGPSEQISHNAWTGHGLSKAAFPGPRDSSRSFGFVEVTVQNQPMFIPTSFSGLQPISLKRPLPLNPPDDLSQPQVAELISTSGLKTEFNPKIVATSPTPSAPIGQHQHNVEALSGNSAACGVMMDGDGCAEDALPFFGSYDLGIGDDHQALSTSLPHVIFPSSVSTLLRPLPSTTSVLPRWRLPPDTKMRIGFLADDFESSVPSAFVELFYLFNRTRFEVHLYSVKEGTSLPGQRSLSPAFVQGADSHHNLHGMNSEDAALLIESHKVHVLFNLRGHVESAKPDLLMMKPAHLQITAFTHQGPFGSPSRLPYTLSDPITSPPNLFSQNYFPGEKLMLVPPSRVFHSLSWRDVVVPCCVGIRPLSPPEDQKSSFLEPTTDDTTTTTTTPPAAAASPTPTTIPSPTSHTTFQSTSHSTSTSTLSPKRDSRYLTAEDWKVLRHGLKRNNFVYAHFGKLSKIDPIIFEVWMQILSRTASRNSVLWLIEHPLSGSKGAKGNLLEMAQAHGIDPTRIVFTQPFDHKDSHRLKQCAHLQLDVLVEPSDAHTTADAMFLSGVPVLTIARVTPMGRHVAALAHAAGVPDLIVSNLHEYEETAVQMSLQSDSLLSPIRAKLNQWKKCQENTTSKDCGGGGGGGAEQEARANTFWALSRNPKLKFAKNHAGNVHPRTLQSMAAIESSLRFGWEIYESGEEPHHVIVSVNEKCQE